MSDLIWGIHPVLEALRSGTANERIYIGEGRRGGGIQEIISEANARRIDVRFEPQERLTKREISHASHQGVVAVSVSFEYASFE